MPDQSLDQQSESAQEPTTTPDDTSANSPTAATQESLESNVTRASEGERQQADVTINQDPVVGDGTADAGGATASPDYSELNLEELREELASRNLPKSGNKPDLIARLQESDASGAAGGGSEGGDSSANLGAETTDAELAEDVPTAGVDPTTVENGGIQRTEAGQQHAEILQGLSDERREQQLALARGGQKQADES